MTNQKYIYFYEESSITSLRAVIICRSASVGCRSGRALDSSGLRPVALVVVAESMTRRKLGVEGTVTRLNRGFGTRTGLMNKQGGDKKKGGIFELLNLN